MVFERFEEVEEDVEGVGSAPEPDATLDDPTGKSPWLS
jgi:hypothetical protein